MGNLMGQDLMGETVFWDNVKLLMKCISKTLPSCIVIAIRLRFVEDDVKLETLINNQPDGWSQ